MADAQQSLTAKVMELGYVQLAVITAAMLPTLVFLLITSPMLIVLPLCGVSLNNHTIPDFAITAMKSEAILLGAAAFVTMAIAAYIYKRNKKRDDNFKIQSAAPLIEEYKL